MSSPVVRKWAQDMMTTIVPEAPYQPTIGVLWERKDLPEIWSTIEYSNSGNQRLTIGKVALWREFGSFTATLVGKSGFGEVELLRLCKKFTDLIMDRQEKLTEESGKQGTLRIDNVGIPTSDPYEDGNWLLASVVCVYTYDSTRGAISAE